MRTLVAVAALCSFSSVAAAKVAVLKVCVWHCDTGTLAEQSPPLKCGGKDCKTLTEVLNSGWRISAVKKIGPGDGDHIRVEVDDTNPNHIKSALLDVYRPPHGAAGQVFHILGVTGAQPAGDDLANWKGSGWAPRPGNDHIEWATPPYGDREMVWLTHP